jgi:hypothetical protein
VEIHERKGLRLIDELTKVAAAVYDLHHMHPCSTMCARQHESDSLNRTAWIVIQDQGGKRTLRASLGTLISHGIFIFPRENELISLGTLKIPWEISVPKLTLTDGHTELKSNTDATGPR